MLFRSELGPEHGISLVPKSWLAISGSPMRCQDLCVNRIVAQSGVASFLFPNTPLVTVKPGRYRLRLYAFERGAGPGSSVPERARAGGGACPHASPSESTSVRASGKVPTLTAAVHPSATTERAARPATPLSPATCVIAGGARAGRCSALHALRATPCEERVRRECEEGA